MTDARVEAFTISPSLKRGGKNISAYNHFTIDYKAVSTYIGIATPYNA